VEIQEFVLKAFTNLGTDFTLSYLDEEGDKIHVETNLELLEATQPSTKENVLLIRLTVESRQKTSDPSIHSIPIYRNETEQNHTNKTI
jgi:thiamine biosynthesis protein ThiC